MDQSPSPSEHISEDLSMSPKDAAGALGPDLTPLIDAADSILAENADVLESGGGGGDGGTNP